MRAEDDVVMHAVDSGVYRLSSLVLEDFVTFRMVDSAVLCGGVRSQWSYSPKALQHGSLVHSLSSEGVMFAIRRQSGEGERVSKRVYAGTRSHHAGHTTSDQFRGHRPQFWRRVPEVLVRSCMSGMVGRKPGRAESGFAGGSQEAPQRDAHEPS